MAAVILLIVVVLAFAWNLGVHYTGAVMGMPYAARAIALWPALILIAVLTVLGATFASGGVEATVGQHIINDRLVRVPDAVVIVLVAGILTLLYNYWRIPTSTIQILVFCVVGVGLAGNISIQWVRLVSWLSCGYAPQSWPLASVSFLPACLICSCHLSWHRDRSSG